MKISTSFCKYFLQSFFISSGIVALNIITCFSWGVLINISWICALILGLLMTLSHSSITKYLHWVRELVHCWIELVFALLVQKVSLEFRWWYEEFSSNLLAPFHFLQQRHLRNSIQIWFQVIWNNVQVFWNLYKSGGQVI